MARDVDSLVVAMKAILVPLMFQLDRSVPPIPFRDDVSRAGVIRNLAPNCDQIKLYSKKVSNV